jgi:hypothetical protein
MSSLNTIAEPSPSPWLPAVSLLVSAVSVKEIASVMPKGELKTQLEDSASQAISTFIDGCGTHPPGPWHGPWPWPGPPPWIFNIASQLAAVANSFHEGGMRNGLLEVAAQVVQHGFRGITHAGKDT